MAKKKPNETTIAYRKERANVLRRVRRLKARGYNLEISIPSIPKKITEASIRNLQKFSTSYLYEHATYKQVLPAVPGVSESQVVIVSGKKGRYIEREKATKKAQRTRYVNKIVKRILEEIEEEDDREYQQERQREVEKYRAEKKAEEQAEESDVDWYKYRSRLDSIERERFESLGNELYQSFNKGNLILNNVEDMIAKASTNLKTSAEHLQEVLDSAINQFGEELIYVNIAEHSEEFLRACELAIRYSSNSLRHDSAIRNIEILILGRELTAEELRALQDAIDKDVY